MQDLTRIGIDLGKHTFHLHGQDRKGKALLRKKMSRKQLIKFLATFQPCTVVMEACAGAHHLARHFTTFGHEVKLISQQFVRPYVKSKKMTSLMPKQSAKQPHGQPCGLFPQKPKPSRPFQPCTACGNPLSGPSQSQHQIHGFLLESGISLPIGHTVIKRLYSVLAEHQQPADLLPCLSDCTRTTGTWTNR